MSADHLYSELSTACNVLTFLHEATWPDNMNGDGKGHISEYGLRGLSYILNHLQGRLCRAIDGEFVNFTDGTSPVSE